MIFSTVPGRVVLGFSLAVFDSLLIGMARKGNLGDHVTIGNGYVKGIIPKIPPLPSGNELCQGEGRGGRKASDHNCL